MKYKYLNIYVLKRFLICYRNTYPNPETTELYGDMHPSNPIVILWPDPLPQKIVINCNTLAGPPSPYK